MEIWSKIKNIYTGKGKWFALFVTAALVYFVWSWFFGSGNTIPLWLDAKREYREQNAQIQMYKTEMEEMDEARRCRESNLDSLEKFAREQYNFAAPGEDVYVIE